MKEPEKAGDEPIDITPKDFAVRTTCQEYGGGAFSCSGDIVVFSNYKDQRLYKQSISSRGTKGSFFCVSCKCLNGCNPLLKETPELEVANSVFMCKLCCLSFNL